MGHHLEHSVVATKTFVRFCLNKALGHWPQDDISRCQLEHARLLLHFLNPVPPSPSPSCCIIPPFAVYNGMLQAQTSTSDVFYIVLTVDRSCRSIMSRRRGRAQGKRATTSKHTSSSRAETPQTASDVVDRGPSELSASRRD